MGFTTRASLLSRVGHEDELGWREFYAMYSPLIRIRGKDHGLDADARAELVQLVMLELFQNGVALRYDPSKGRFRDFLRVVVDRRAIDAKRRLLREAGKCGEAELAELPDESSADLCQAWEDEWRMNVMRQALSELKAKVEPETYQAFDLYALNGWSPKETAKFLGIKVASVYLAKSRCVALLEELVAELQSLEG